MLLAQFCLSVSPFIPFVRDNIWATQTSVNQFASTLAAYVGLQFLCFSLLVPLVLYDIKDQAEKASADLGSMLRQYTPLQVRRLKEGQFYKEFLGSCTKAGHYVKICYFSPQPPEHGSPRERGTYYKHLTEVIKDNPDITFKRIVRDSEANRKWILDLASQLSDATNCSLALLADQIESVQMPLALSVQIVDGREAWLVAIGEHTGAATYRDIAIENELVAEALDRYFDRLWSLSRVVFKPGDSPEAIHHAIFEGR